ncbi:MAG: hypothetical protein Q4C20_15505 [Erysipelotrichaceae bacterium]|nr:hypothetical protein [Erysipelotrichaceae bacterium]
MKQKLKELFWILVDMPFQVIFVLIALSFLLLTCIRFFSISSPFLLIPIWTLVIYTSIMTIYWIWLFISSKRLQEDLEVFEIMQKNSLGLCLSMELNLLMSVYYIYVAVRYQNQWFIDSAFFYTSLTIARFAMLRTYQFDKPSMLQQYRLYMMIGYLMFAMMTSLFLMTVMIVNEHYIVHYPGHSLYAAAAFSIYLIISAFSGYFRHRHYKSPLLSGTQMISISAALLGVLSLQTAFLPMFTDNPEIHRIANLITGTIVFTIMIVMSAHMVIRGGRKVDYYLSRFNAN